MIKHYPMKNFDIRVYQQQKVGMDCCGDSFFIKETHDYILCGIADGLGSGQFAKKASVAAIEALAASKDESLLTMMHKVNDSQQNLRGVVMSLFKIDLASGRGCFCGVGNINLIINDNKEMLYAQPLPEKGYFPSKPLQYKVHEFQFPKAGWFALYSDGIRIRPKQLHHLYEMIGPDNKEKATDDVNALSICNVNDDATLLIGKSV